MTRDPGYWTGSLSMAAALALRALPREPQTAEEILSRNLTEFLRERPEGDELADMLREEMKR